MPTNFAEIPFFRIAIAFIAGISLHNYAADNALYYIFFAIVLIVIMSFYFLNKSSTTLLTGLVIIGIAAISGYLRTEGLEKKERLLHFTELECEDNYLIEGKIVEVNERARSMALVVAIKTAVCEKGSIRANKYNRGKILVSSLGKERFEDWVPGTSLRFIAPVKEIPPPSNPNSFSFKNFMARKRIYHQVFIAETEIHIIGSDQNKFRTKVFLFRRAFIENLKKYTFKENTAGILTGIVLGDKSIMDDEIHKAFRDVGAAHVLAVSGLHVGIVFSLLFFGLKKLPNWATASISIIGIWAFIILAGMPPSAMRAGTMFTLFSLGKLINKRAHPINILSFCALIHLFNEPMLLMDVGFQFSYLALLGIIVFFNKINARIPCPHYSLKIPRDLTSLSVAAQIGVLPLSIYYFNQASPYFMLSSIFSVMGAYILLSGGLFIGLVGFILPPIASLAGALLDWVAEILANCMLFFTKLPGATISEMYLSIQPLLIIYFLILLFALIIYRRLKRYQPILMVSFIVFLLSGFITKNDKTSTNSIYMYSSGRALLIDVFTPKKIQTIYCNHLTEATEHFSAHNNRIAYGTKSRNQQRILADSTNNLQIVRGSREDIIICSFNTFPESLIKLHERPFHLVFTHSNKWKNGYHKILSDSNIASITSAAGNTFSFNQRLENLAKELGIEFNNTFNKYQSIKNF